MAKKKGIDVNGVILVIVIVLVVGLSLGIFYKAPVGEAGEGELAQMRPNANVPLTLDELRNGIYLKRRTTITWTESLDDVPVGNAFKGIMGDLDYIIRPKGRDRYWYNPNYYPDKNNINIKKERFFSKLEKGQKYIVYLKDSPKEWKYLPHPIMILKDGTEVAITPSTSINYGVDPEGLVKREKFCSLPFRITSLDYFYPDARIGQTLGHITVNTFKIELEDDAKEGYSKSYPGLVEGFGLKYNLYAKSELGAVLIDAGDASYIRDGKWSVSMTNMPKQKGEYFFEFVLYCTQKESYCSDNFDYETQSKLLADFVVN